MVRPRSMGANLSFCIFVFFFNDPATTEIYTLSLHDALPICPGHSNYTGEARKILYGE